MAKRNNKIRIDTSECQGEGSFVVLRRMTLDELTGLAEATEGASTSEQIAYSRAIVAEYVEDWDWVDDDDNPLPLPKHDPDVVGRLTDTELRIILDGFAPQEREKKA